MSTDLAVTSGTLSDRMEFAKALATASLLPRAYQGNPGNVLLAIELGHALGIAPVQAITSVHVVEGKPTASADLIASLVRRAGHRLRVEGDDRQATAQIIRADDPDFTYTATWTMDRARTAGLAAKDVWRKYPAAMLKARAITEVARMGASDALHGVTYTPEEAEDRTLADDRPAGPLAPRQRLAAVLRPAEDHPEPVATIEVVEVEPDPDPITLPQQKALHTALGTIGYTEREDKLAYLTDRLGREITSSSDLTKAEASTILDEIGGRS